MFNSKGDIGEGLYFRSLMLWVCFECLRMMMVLEWKFLRIGDVGVGEVVLEFV